MHLSQEISVFESSRSSWLVNILQQVCEDCWLFLAYSVYSRFPFGYYSPHHSCRWFFCGYPAKELPVRSAYAAEVINQVVFPSSLRWREIQGLVPFIDILGCTCMQRHWFSLLRSRRHPQPAGIKTCGRLSLLLLDGNWRERCWLV